MKKKKLKFYNFNVFNNKIKHQLTSMNCFTVLSTTINGLLIKWTTPFFMGILALTISATTAPVGCTPSPTTVSLLT